MGWDLVVARRRAYFLRGAMQIDAAMIVLVVTMSGASDGRWKQWASSMVTMVREHRYILQR
jgi:hypothetical protein